MAGNPRPINVHVGLLGGGDQRQRDSTTLFFGSQHQGKGDLPKFCH